MLYLFKRIILESIYLVNNKKNKLSFNLLNFKMESFMEFLNDLQNFYSNIEKIAEILTSSLKNQSLPIDSGWYNDHYHIENGNWIREAYPIKVLTLNGLCDIEIGFFNIAITSKLKKEQALLYNFSSLESLNLKYDVYGVENFLLDFKNEFFDEKETIKNKIKNSSEENIAFSFYFELNSSKSNIQKIVNTINLLRANKFFY